MLFNSIEFFVFFPITVALYYLLPHIHRWKLLLTASLLFYMAFIPKYIFILFFIITLDYFSAILIDRSEGTKRKVLLILSLAATLSVLFLFKYFNFFSDSTASIARLINWNYPTVYLNIILPLGLSFHTFQALSYVIEVYRGTQKVERHIGIFALYTMFFPQLVAGPIERPKNLLHQFYEKHEFRYDQVTGGLKLMVWGLFKKVVIADRLAIVVNQVYNDPLEYSGIPLSLATIFFTFQIFCDFSGYSDIAIGSAQVMGFNLMKNFNRPYFAKSVSEFWKRWHISLSTWFKDYLYIPLGGNRTSKARWQFNLLVTFVLSGLWHGANWTFLIWGALHGTYILLSNASNNIRARFVEATGLINFPNIHKVLKVSATFSLISFAWIFFRANSLSDALYISSHIFVGWKEFFSYLAILDFDRALLYVTNQGDGLGLSMSGLLLAIVSIIFMEWVHLVQRNGSVRAMLRLRPSWLRELARKNWTTL